jgi:hypothetical protein
MSVSSSSNWTLDTPTESVAVAATDTVPVTLPLDGLVILTVGGVVSIAHAVLAAADDKPSVLSVAITLKVLVPLSPLNVAGLVQLL